MEEFEKFRLWDAAMLVGSILTFLADQVTDIILAVTFYYYGHYWYSAITVVLILLPNAIVQVFSARWNQIDDSMSRPVGIIHGLLLGIIHRYYRVLTLGLEARGTDDVLDYQRYYQQWSDICMLRLFDSFMESAPQLVFQLYVMVDKSDTWTPFNVAWTAVSAVASTVSLGWGIAAYSQALRIVRDDKGKLSWVGMILQILWRFFMLSARIVALVMLVLTLHHWSVLIIFVHWLVMTGWVVWQDTDFCNNPWEERLYNAVVGVIYCFCFFNLKEGRSRYRMTIFYSITFVENATFVGLYYGFGHHLPDIPVTWFSLGAMGIVIGGTLIGLVSMVIYYRFYHPAGPIPPCGLAANSKIKDNNEDGQKSPGFTIEDVTYDNELDGSHNSRVQRSATVGYSRSFKFSASFTKNTNATLSPSKLGKSQMKVSPGGDIANSSPVTLSQPSPAQVCEKVDSAYSTDSNRTVSRNTEASPTLFPNIDKSPNTSTTSQVNQSITGATNNHNRSHSSIANRSGSSLAFNNDTYVSIESTSPTQEQTYMKICTPKEMSPYKSADNTYQSVHPLSESTRSDANTSQESQVSRITVVDKNSTPRRPKKDLLKRSPVVKDVTNAFIPIMSPANEIDKQQTENIKSDNSKLENRTEERLHAPLTIIIPNISNQAYTKSNSCSPDKWSDNTISMDILNPGNAAPDTSNLAGHDYENLALVNINRAPLGVQHWRTYSDVADGGHDESTKYEKQNKLNGTSSTDYSTYSSLAYCDIYPLSKEMKEQLYRSLTPVSTAATMSSSIANSDVSSNHTYEPIETASRAFDNYDDYVNAPDTSTITLIHHDGNKVTANRIVSMNNLREVLQNHEKVPMDDPEKQEELYILAPMRLLTPIMEESESEMTKSKLYQSSNMTVQSNTYSEVSNSIMSIVSEVLNARSENSQTMRRSVSQKANAPQSSSSLMMTIDEDNINSSSLVHTIEEIRNNSLCNLYYSSSFSDTGGAAKVPEVPSRNSVGYDSLCKENKLLKNVLKDCLTNSPASLNSASSTPVTVKPSLATKKKSPLSASVGSRKNILNLVTTTNDILNTPKKVKTNHPEKLSLPKQSNILSDIDNSVSGETNEFKSLMPHLTYQGAKFLNKIKSSAASDSENDPDSPCLRKARLEKSLPLAGLKQIKENPVILSPSCRYTPDVSSISEETPSPKQFVRNITNQIKPRRHFPIGRKKFEDTSDEKYGFFPENPDLKYGFGYFGDSSSVVETAKLSNSYRTFTAGLEPYSNGQHVETQDGMVKFPSVPSITIPTSMSLTVLNKSDKEFKLKPDETYENLQRNWVTSSLQRRPKGSAVERHQVGRRSMSMLDDFEEKENMVPSKIMGNNKKKPLGAPGNPSPLAFSSNNANSILSPNQRVYRIQPNKTTSPKPILFRK